MDVKTTMTRDPACCTPDMPLPAVARMMLEHDCGEIPVVDDRESRRPIGVVTDRDITVRVVAQGLDALSHKARDCMTAPCITVGSEASLIECCELMEREKIRRVPVVDSLGRLCGIVALADVAVHAGKRATLDVVREVSLAAGAVAVHETRAT